MKRRRVFFVEDEPLIASGIERKIVQLGYEVAGSASSGEAAIRAIASDPPDLILMDIKLDGKLDGIETAAEVRAHHDIPVVFLTAYADEATLSRATQQDPFAYIVKPFTDRELFGAIEVAMHRHELHCELKKQGERYRMLSEVLSDFAFSIVFAGGETPGNLEWSVGDLSNLVGVEESSLTSVEDFLYVVVPEDVQRVRELWQSLRSGRDGSIEFRVMRNEKPEWIKMDARSESLSNGTLRLYGSLQNITALRETESRLVQREFEFSQIVHTMRQGIWVGDADNVCIYANTALCEMTGYSREEIVGRNSLSILLGSRSDLLANDDAYEVQLRRKDGDSLTVLITPRRILDDEGALRGSFNLIVDVTQQRRSMDLLTRRRRQLEGVFHASPTPSLLIDAATNAVLDVNEAFVDLTGFDRDAVVGFGGFGLADYEDLDDLNRMVALLKARSSRTDSIKLRNTSGGSLHLNVEVKEIVVDDEELLLLILTRA